MNIVSYSTFHNKNLISDFSVHSILRGIHIKMMKFNLFYYTLQHLCKICCENTGVCGIHGICGDRGRYILCKICFEITKVCGIRGIRGFCGDRGRYII